MRDTRPFSDAPRAAWAAFGLLLGVQVTLALTRPARAPAADDLPPPPRPAILRAGTLGEHAAFARLAMLHLQAFDLSGGNTMPYRNLDYARLVGWLRAIRDIDPRSDYPLFAAARVYAENPDPARSRLALDFVHESFLLDPDRRWPWLAHAALLAKHRLRDLPLARQYASDIVRLTHDPKLPDWARQMEVFILEDMGEVAAARVLLGAMLAGGRIHDPAERRYLEHHLRELESRAGPGGTPGKR